MHIRARHLGIGLHGPQGIFARTLHIRARHLGIGLHGPQGIFARTWSTGAIAFWAVVFLYLLLLLYFWNR